MKKLLLLTSVLALAGCTASTHYIYSPVVPADPNAPQAERYNLSNYVCEDNTTLVFDTAKPGPTYINFDNFLGDSILLQQDPNNPNHYSNPQQRVDVIKNDRNIVVAYHYSLVTCSQYETRKQREERLARETEMKSHHNVKPVVINKTADIKGGPSIAAQVEQARLNAEAIEAKVMGKAVPTANASYMSNMKASTNNSYQQVKSATKSSYNHKVTRSAKVAQIASQAKQQASSVVNNTSSSVKDAIVPATVAAGNLANQVNNTVDNTYKVVNTNNSANNSASVPQSNVTYQVAPKTDLASARQLSQEANVAFYDFRKAYLDRDIAAATVKLSKLANLSATASQIENMIKSPNALKAVEPSLEHVKNIYTQAQQLFNTLK